MQDIEMTSASSSTLASQLEQNSSKELLDANVSSVSKFYSPSNANISLTLVTSVGKGKNPRSVKPKK